MGEIVPYCWGRRHEAPAEVGSLAKAKAFYLALRVILNLPSVRGGSQETSFYISDAPSPSEGQNLLAVQIQSKAKHIYMPS